MTACWLILLSLSLLSPFVFLRCLSVSPSLQTLKAVIFFLFLSLPRLLHLLYVWCSAQVPACSCFSPVISRHCFECYLSILHAILVSQLCGARVIVLPSLFFYLCIIFWVISALLSPCYRVPRSRWWPLSSWQLLKTALDVLAAPFSFFCAAMKDYCDFERCFFFPYCFHAECQNIWFSKFVLVPFFQPVCLLHRSLLDAYVFIRVKHAQLTGMSLFLPATAICLLPSFAYACVYMAASLCCYIWFRAWYDS